MSQGQMHRPHGRHRRGPHVPLPLGLLRRHQGLLDLQKQLGGGSENHALRLRLAREDKQGAEVKNVQKISFLLFAKC